MPGSFYFLKFHDTIWAFFGNMLNYGSDKLRFTGAVPAGSKIHARSRVKSIERLPKGTRFTLEQNVHVVGQERPALVYELVFIYQ